jgi:hypothetical protein
MQNETIKKVATEIKNDSPLNKTLFLIALLTTGVLLLGIQQKWQEQSKYEEIGANYYDLTHPPVTNRDE